MFEQVDLSDVKLVKEFGMGCLTVKGAHLWPLDHIVWESSASTVGCTFFSEGMQAPWEKLSLLRIEVFKLPKAKSELADRIKWYTRDRKKRRIKVSDGMLFDESMLHAKTLPEEWERDALIRSKGEIIQIYTSKKFAVIFRFMAKSGSMLDHPIFKRVTRNIHFDAAQWEKEVPNIIEPKSKSKRFSETSLSQESEDELWQCVGTAMKRMNLARVKDAAERMGAIELEIEAARSNKSLDDDQLTELAIELGCFAGQLFCWELDWEWRVVEDTKDGKKTEAVCSKNRALAIDPIDWVYSLITNKKRPCNCTLLFNMIKAGRLPPSRPNAYAWIS